MKTLLLFLALILVAAGCATEPDPTELDRDFTVQPRDPDVDERDRDPGDMDDAVTDPRELPSLEVVTYSSGDFNSEDTIRLNDFSRATVFASILEALELAQAMSEEQRRDLHDAIFRGVPEQGSGTFRAVAVSDYFTSGEPLYLLLGVDDPAPDAPEETVRTVFVQSSVLRDGDRIATRSYGRLVDMTVNVSWIYHLDENGIVRETAIAYTPRLAGRRLDDAMPHELVEEQPDEDETQRITLQDLLDTGATIESPRVVPDEFIVEPPPVIDVSEPFTVETQAALDRGAEPVAIPEAPAERVRLANRLVESAVSTDSLNVPMLVDSLIRDDSVDETVRVEAAFVRVLYAMLYENENVVDDHAETLLSVREETSSLPPRLAYRIDTIVPVLLETYRYDTEGL